MKRGTEIAIAVGGVVLLIVIGVVVYFTVFHGKNNERPDGRKYYFCKGQPKIDHECMHCADGPSHNWVGPYNTLDECNSNRNAGSDGTCILYKLGDCNVNNPHNTPGSDSPPEVQVNKSHNILAGAILNNEHAKKICPGICKKYGYIWKGDWKTTERQIHSVCVCSEE